MPTHIDDVCIWCQYASEKRKAEDLQAEVERLRELLRPALAHHGIMRESDLKDVVLYFDELKHKGGEW